MSNDKIIAFRKLTTLDRDGRILVITAKLHLLQGNKRPYFSCTADGLGYGGGCHEEVLAVAPEFAQAVALHLSDDNGVPMHAIENGWYWLGKTEYQARDNAILADHLRISLEEAETLDFGDKTAFVCYVGSQGQRWQAEADALRAWLDGSETATEEAAAWMASRKARILKASQRWK